MIFPGVDTGYDNANYGSVFCSDLYSYAKDVNPNFIGSMTLDEALAMNSFDEDAGLFTLQMVYYVSAGAFDNGYEYLQLPGYEQESVDVALNGKYISQAGDEMQVFSIRKSSGVAEVKYEVYTGTASASQAETLAEALATDAEASSISESGNIAVALEEGEYTIVVAGLDESGAMIAWNYLTFEFVSAATDPNAGWTSLGNVLYGEDYFASAMSNVEVTNYMVEMQASDEDQGVYRLVNPYGEAWPYYGMFRNVGYTANNHYLEFMLLSGNLAIVVNSEMNMTLDGDEIAMGSLAYNNVAGGQTLQQQIDAGLVGSIADNKITMPVRSLVWWIGDDGYYANVNGGFQIDLDPDGEEEEEASAYSIKNIKNFGASIKSAIADRVEKAQVRRHRDQIVFDFKSWERYQGSSIQSTMTR